MSVLPASKVLYDFGDPESVHDWIAVNDGVMGGISSGEIETTGEGTVAFRGKVSLANNGGFASLRSRPFPWNLADSAGVEIHVRGDGKRYKLSLWTESYLDGISYRAAFETSAEGWQTLRLPFSEFRASFRGRAVPGAPPLDPAEIVSIGFLISDRQAGPFRLEIGRIGAYGSN